MKKYSFIKDNDNVILINETSESKISLKTGSYKIIYDGKINKDITFMINDNEEVEISEIHLGEEEANISYVLGKNTHTAFSFYYYGDLKCAKANIKTLEKAYININSVYLLKNENKVSLDIYLGSDSKLDLNGAAINSTSKEQTININVYHDNINSETNMYFYGICLNDSRLNINTDGIIKKGAINSIMHQITKGLIISPNSMISANPLLHIDDNDVLASHGASIGTIDDEELFYLMSRGLTKEESEELIIKGFLQPIIRSLEDNSLKEQITKELNKE